MNAADGAREPSSVEQRARALELRVTRLRGVIEALLWAWLAVPLALALLFVERPGGLLMSRVFDLGHVLLSAWVAWVAFRVSQKVAHTHGLRVHLTLAMAAVVLLGGGLELVQLYAPGEPSWWDMASDLAGGLAAILAMAASQASLDTRVRWCVWGLAGAALLGSVASPGSKILRELLRKRLFPTLATFDDFERDAWELNGGAMLIPVDTPPSAHPVLGAHTVLLTLPVTEFPGIGVTPPAGDWGAYDSLHLTVYSLAQDAVPFEVRVHDRAHSRRASPRSPQDRFSAPLLVHPGANHIRFAMSDIQRTPSGRMMNLAEVEQVVLFTPLPIEPIQLLLGPWKLETDVDEP